MHYETITVHHFFSVGPGSSTIYFQGKSTHEQSSVDISNLTIMFFPTAYGLISPRDEESGTSVDGSYVTGPTLENLINERVDMQTAALKASFESELTQLRQTNQSLINRLEALEQRSDN